VVDEGIGLKGSPSIAIARSLEAWFSCCTAFVDEEAVAAAIEKAAALVALPTISLIMIVN
jgi:hypothetical protein